MKKEEAEKLCAHYGKSEAEGVHDSHEVQTEDGKTVTMGTVRKALHSDAPKAKKK